MDNIIFPNNNFKMRLISVDLATVLTLIRLSHIYQQLYHTFSQIPSPHQKGMDGDGRSTQLVEEEEELEAADLKLEEAAVGVVEEDAKDESKEI